MQLLIHTYMGLLSQTELLGRDCLFVTSEIHKNL